MMYEISSKNFSTALETVLIITSAGVVENFSYISPIN